jgi:hypothetical protein
VCSVLLATLTLGFVVAAVAAYGVLGTLHSAAVTSIGFIEMCSLFLT